MVEPLEITNSVTTVEFCLSWDPCFAIIRWKGASSHMCVSTRPSPPYRDWIPDRAPPCDYGRLVFESRMHHRCLLGFAGNRDQASQTENSENLIQIVPKRPPPTRASHQAMLAREAAGQDLIRTNIPVRPRPSMFFDDEIVRRAHTSESVRNAFLAPTYVPDAQFRRPGTQGARRPIYRQPLALEGFASSPSFPTESRALPPAVPPSNHPQGSGALFPRPEGIRFLYTEPALRLRTPEIAVPPAMSVSPDLIRRDPELDPDA